MQQLLARYLLQHKILPLPGAGVLIIMPGSAVVDSAEKTIAAPVPSIRFETRAADAEHLISYIAAEKKLSKAAAAKMLTDTCDGITGLTRDASFSLPGAGVFSRDDSDELIFSPTSVAPAFLPAVRAERVVHAHSSHAMLVGDRETNTVAMTEFFAGTDRVRTPKKYLRAALILFVLSAAVFIFYLNDKNRNSFYGISHTYEPLYADSTYHLIKN